MTALLRAVYSAGGFTLRRDGCIAADASAVRSPCPSIVLILGTHECEPYGTTDGDDRHGTACGRRGRAAAGANYSYYAAVLSTREMPRVVIEHPCHTAGVAGVCRWRVEEHFGSLARFGRTRRRYAVVIDHQRPLAAVIRQPILPVPLRPWPGSGGIPPL
jgi:hypothetical protein